MARHVEKKLPSRLTHSRWAPGLSPLLSFTSWRTSTALPEALTTRRQPLEVACFAASKIRPLLGG